MGSSEYVCYQYFEITILIWSAFTLCIEVFAPIDNLMHK